MNEHFQLPYLKVIAFLYDITQHILSWLSSCTDALLEAMVVITNCQ